jgi:uncharacterized protein
VHGTFAAIPAKAGIEGLSASKFEQLPYKMRKETAMNFVKSTTRFAVLTYLALGAAFFSAASFAATASSTITWHPWSDDVFEQARREHKFVLLDLEAVWCHWCHVMDEKTYANPAVIRLMNSRYLMIRVDQDARPDISRRYENYGWPATVVFAADGSEIVKRRGYLPPERMTSMLKAIIKDPSPIHYAEDEPIRDFAKNAVLGAAVRADLQQRFLKTSDTAIGGFDAEQRFIDRDTIEYALIEARRGETAGKEVALKIARSTLNGELNIIDPVWGGAYQYSTDRDWAHPHFEKIMQVQADTVRVYALAYAELGDPAYLKAAQDIARFAETFLTSPEGAFYVSMDADLVKGEHSAEYFALDDAGRRRLGIPALDKHVYARENGWMIASLAQLYALTGEKKYLDEAQRAANWIVEHRNLADGGFRHDERDAAGPYLEDTLAMGRAFLELYAATADRGYLARAEDAAKFIEHNFRADALDKRQQGYVSVAAVRPASDAVRAKAKPAAILKPRQQVDENIGVARFANLLAHYSGDDADRKMAERAMRYLATPRVAQSRMTDAGILLADEELATPPTHLAIVGRKDDGGAAGLFAAALRYPAAYRRIEWWDRREGKLPNADVQYPELDRAAAFVCTDHSCSLPVFAAADVQDLLKDLGR